MMRRPLCAGPVSAPYLVCRACGRSCSMWTRDCPVCTREAELPPVVGEAMRDVLAARTIEGED